MRAIILISAIYIAQSICRSRGVKSTQEQNNADITVFWIALIYAVILDLNE